METVSSHTRLARNARSVRGGTRGRRLLTGPSLCEIVFHGKGRRTGAAVEFQRQFNPRALWRRLGEPGASARPRVTVFMGVPTMFVLLTRTLLAMPEAARAEAAAAAGGLRLTVRSLLRGGSSLLS